ncbi:subtype A tannase [Pseudobutyrivibrio sp. MD2005]|uniref:subtype A tannase n=1 Tax=Pseudobutyrivibrio sp. MD2005 TaxID=1410616 RepID=UPI000480C800|nr:subtype A tannase [Pseudobutyrivibrio sp. MD2005]
MKKRLFKMAMAGMMSFSLVACGQATSSSNDSTTTSAESSVDSSEIVTNLAQIDNTKWLYNEDDNVYYQIGIQYCENPADLNYETLAVYVPGEYMNATDNGDGTYTCEINYDNTAGSSNYTAATAPIALPVNTPGYAAMDAPTEYDSNFGYGSVSDYTSEGFILVVAGCRGRDAGAPAGVTDLKAAIRYIRYNDGNIAGNMERVFTLGMSGGGAQSALLGITGDSALYDPYLEEIGAVMGVSDAVMGSQSWCPITNLDSADAAYEWNMGNTRTDLTDEEQEISDSLTAYYADYINALGLTDEDGNVLTLEESEDGRYQAGTYYEYIKDVIETSLNNFLEDTEFPYDADASSQGGGMGGPGGDRGDFDPENAPEGMEGFGGPDKDTESTDASEETDYTAIDDISRTETTSGITISGTYETVQDYIDALNANGTWVTYDEETNTATITSVSDFAAAVKNVSKELGAFDQLDGGQGENTLFGYGDGEGAHFDSALADILEEIGSDYAEDYAEDLTKTDSVGNTVDVRLNMYSPMYYLLSSSEGYQSSSVAQYFRINTGLWQSDTAVNTEANLALALENYSEDIDVDFTTVWGMQHTTAERTGDSTANFIEWVNECLAEQ